MINMTFDERNKDIESVDDIVRKTVTDCYTKNDWFGMRGCIVGIDKDNGDILLLFREYELPFEEPDSDVVTFVTGLKDNLVKSGYEVIEDRAAKSEEFKNLKFEPRLFRLRKQ